jgi:hypothetical protein
LHKYTLKDNEVLIKVDRTTIVGNIFKMNNYSDIERNRVCDEYQKYFDDIIINKDNHYEFINYLRNIYVVALHHDIALGCWCYPKRCHAETIKAFIDSYLD